MYCFSCESDTKDDVQTCEACGRPLDCDPDRFFRVGMDALFSGELERSTRLLGECVKLNPDHLSGRYNLGLALCMADRCEEAMEQYLAVAEREPDYPGIYTVLGQAAFGDYLLHSEQAESRRRAMFDLLAKAVEIDPSDVDAHYSLANAYMAIGSPREALPWLKKAVTLHPDSSAIYYTLGKAYRMLQRNTEATAMARLAMELSVIGDPLMDEIETLLVECEQS